MLARVYPPGGDEQIHIPTRDWDASECRMFNCTKCEKREFQMTQLSEMRLLAECASCGTAFIVDSIMDKHPRIEAADPNQHLIWDWKTEHWVRR